MRDWRRIVGAGMGLVAAAFVVGTADPPGLRDPQEPYRRQDQVLSDCDGRIRELVIHYVKEAGPITGNVYRDFMRQLGSDVAVFAVCPDQAAFDDLRNRTYPVHCRVVPVLTGHAMTCWSRDRWLALPAKGTGGKTLLLTPSAETGARAWPARAGDELVARDLADTRPDSLTAHRSHLAFDGGDFVSDAEAVFVTPRVGQRSVGSAVPSLTGLRRELTATLRKRVILLANAPSHHAGMFMMPVGEKRVLVGDPTLAKHLLRGTSFATLAGPDPDFSGQTRERFAAVAAACTAEGYQVTRMPVVPGLDSRSYWTYLNVIIDQDHGQRIVYMPVYDTADALNAAAAAVWQGLGYEVRTVNCTSTFRHGGSLRCLVNVLSRGDGSGEGTGRM